MKSRVLAPTRANIKLVAEALKAGEIAGIPTETVYGLAAIAQNESAVAKVFRAKERPTFDPLIVHIAQEHVRSLDDLARLELVDTSTLSIEAKKLINLLIAEFWPGPLTLVLPKHRSVPDLVTSGLQRVAIRMPAHIISQSLLFEVGLPLAAPSANRFGRISPTSARDVVEELGDQVALILDGGPCASGIESTVISVSELGRVTLLRPGAIATGAIGRIARIRVYPSDETEIAAPGMLPSHYAPAKPMVILPTTLAAMSPAQWQELKTQIGPTATVGFLLPYGDERAVAKPLSEALGRPPSASRTLTRDDEDDLTAARNLFSSIRALDNDRAVDVILVEPCNLKNGLWPAIVDRLERASAKR